MDNAMNFSYEYLKQEIKQYEIQEQLAFDNTLQELRRDKFINKYSSIVDKYTGKIFRSTNSGDFIVTEYFNYDKIAIVFMNTGYKMLARANNINKGEVKDPYAPSILGFGCIGVGPYKVDGSPFERMIYSRWRGILDRCYIKREGNKTVDKEWFNFQYFAAWFSSEFYTIPYYSMYNMTVDKDVLVPLNEEYGPTKCLILPNFINLKVQIKEHERTEIAKIARGQMSQFDILRFLRQKESKEAKIRELADKYQNVLPPHVFLAIKQYRMF